MQNNESGMFKPGDEERMCQVLKAFVEEWGPEAVIVKVPTYWKDYGTSGSLGRVRLDFVTENTVEIWVEYERVRLQQTIQVNTPLAT